MNYTYTRTIATANMQQQNEANKNSGAELVGKHFSGKLAYARARSAHEIELVRVFVQCVRAIVRMISLICLTGWLYVHLAKNENE